MQIGLVTDPRLDRSWEGALDLAVRNGITHVEPCGGGHVPTTYVDPLALARDEEALAEFADSISSRTLRIASLGCYGNPLHPDKQRADAAHADLLAMFSVAAKLDVRRVTVISGVPGGGPHDRAPNWIIPSIYADLSEAYRWQWEQRLIPYWRDACQVAADHGVTICMEPIAGFMVYNVQTFARLRDACGETLAANLDPSHLWWMGIDPINVVHDLAGAIAYVHAKDARLDAQRIARNGVASAVPYAEWDQRSWIYRAVGFGHPESWWKDFFTALRGAGYDGVASIEVEEPYMTVDEALEKSVDMVRRTLPFEPIPESNYFDHYDYQPAHVE